MSRFHLKKYFKCEKEKKKILQNEMSAKCLFKMIVIALSDQIYLSN